jgi:hypothetical protein
LEVTPPFKRHLRRIQTIAANIVVRNPAEILATYRVEQLADSVKISSEVAHASTDVMTAAAREGQMTRACLDEGGF